MPDPLNKAPRDLDRFDRAILRLVQADNKLPQRKIGEAVSLSAAAVQRRIAAIEASGVIARNVAIVDPDAVPLTITSIVEVQLIDERAPTVEQARQLFLDTAEVQQCYYVTGGVSFMLVIVTSDMRAYSALTKRLFSENAFIASYRSLIALDRVKAGTDVIIP
ncbi:Lrp/AsnC family transcriptional regulator [Sphingomonas sp. KR3-1]|uniref:Lrp/AsnC family transcriptional regulator n=1 Tax=Sphingomonas sp. KR3-1 TaxID=3156611 RepID=UPI0032B5483F